MRWFFAILLWFSAGPLFAQGVATLVADSITVEDQQRLLASGGVEVYFDGYSLTAEQVTFDQTTDRLEIVGPLVVRTVDGAVFTAERADLDPAFENGLLRSARLVLNQQLQLAASQINRVDGRYSQLYKAAVTSCQVCGLQTPLWQIRAERVIHDEVDRQIYFRNATLLIKDVPVFWLPRLRLPDPSLDRASGFLIPRIRTTDQLRTGIKIPYFLAIGDHKDLTITPYFSSETRTLETRYRQAFLNGDIQVNLDVSNDSLRPDITRGYLSAVGEFQFPGEFQLNFDVENTTDSAYLLDYGLSSKDRLDSAISISRTRENDIFLSSLTYYESLREGEANSTLPPIVADLTYERRISSFPTGSLYLGLSADAIARTTDGADLGRDVSRVGADLRWNNRWISPGGLVSFAEFTYAMDVFGVRDDPSSASQILRSSSSANVILSYPLIHSSAARTTLFEPLVALSWRGSRGDDTPNEDSTRPELDSGNLLWADRLPGEDVNESGLSAAVALRWTFQTPSGRDARLTFGRVYQDTTNLAFNQGSGLDGKSSDWLIAAQLDLLDGLKFDSSLLVSAANTNATLATAGLDWTTERLKLTANYIWQISDEDLGTDAISEWSFDTEYRYSDNWKVAFDARYDVVADTPTRAGLGIEWRNECTVVDFTVSRRFTSSSNVEPSTDFGLSIELTGFSTAPGIATPASRCNN